MADANTVIVILAGMVTTLVGALLWMHYMWDKEHHDHHDEEIKRLRDRMHSWAGVIAWARYKAELELDDDDVARAKKRHDDPY